MYEKLLKNGKEHTSCSLPFLSNFSYTFSKQSLMRKITLLPNNSHVPAVPLRVRGLVHPAEAESHLSARLVVIHQALEDGPVEGDHRGLGHSDAEPRALSPVVRLDELVAGSILAVYAVQPRRL